MTDKPKKKRRTKRGPKVEEPQPSPPDHPAHHHLPNEVTGGFDAYDANGNKILPEEPK